MVKSEKKMLKTCTLKNYKALLRGSKDLNKWRDVPSMDWKTVLLSCKFFPD